MTDTHTTAHIPDEAVQAFIDRYEIGCNHRYDENSIRAALAAALPHLPLGFEVKKLEWVPMANGGFTCIDDNKYSIDFWDKEKLYVGSYTTMERSKNVDDVKEALQKQFEHRVRECITLTNEGTKPVDVAAVRKQAFEEAMQAIAELPTGKDESEENGHENAYRAVEALRGQQHDK